jgi:hypothetical protein
MTDKKKLTDIICEGLEADGCIAHCNHPPCSACERIADNLIENNVVILPVYIGKPVWVASAWYNNLTKEIDSGVVEGKVSMLQQKADKSWKFRVTTKYVSDYELGDIGTYIFFTKEDAEKALEEKIKTLEEKYGM